MPRDYDRILKENIGLFFLSLAERHLGLRLRKVEELKDQFHRTLEREPDFLRRVEDLGGHAFILHLEFQTRDESRMRFRMQEYHALLQQRYRLPVRQFVLFLGQQPSRMINRLKPEERYEGFDLLAIGSLPSDKLLDSDIPEEIILALLSDFGPEAPDTVIRRILQRLQQLSQDPLVLERYVHQLRVLARLRNLSTSLKTNLEAMDISFDIKKDAFYQEGRQEGRQEGHQEGEYQRALKSARKGLQKGLGVEDVAEISDLPLDTVRQIARELGLEP